MKPLGQLDTLRQLAQRLMAPNAGHGEWYRASTELHRFLLTLSGLDMRTDDCRRNLFLPMGAALAPAWAALCVQDYLRTRAFLRGTLAAIQAAGRRFSAGPVHVLYAGCGPFAALVLPLLPLLPENAAVFTLLDVSPVSTASLQRLVATLGLQRWIRDVVTTDAVTYRAPAESPIHVLVGEMMQAGLRREPQVAAMLNLVPQLLPGGFLVPQRIQIQAGLLCPQQNERRMLNAGYPAEKAYQVVASLLTLASTTIVRHQQRETQVFPEIRVTLPTDRDPRFHQLALFTTLDVFGQEKLAVWESALTQPVLLSALNAEASSKRLGFQYHLGPDPGFHWRFLP